MPDESFSDEEGVSGETQEQFDAFLNESGWIHYAGMLIPQRPGIHEFCTTLEHTYFPPHTERNDLFQMRLIRWQDMVWCLVSIPTRESNIVPLVAAQCGLRVADGVPTLLTAQGADTFPANGPNVFTLENVSGHAVYRNDPATDQRLAAQEREAVDRQLSRGNKKGG